MRNALVVLALVACATGITYAASSKPTPLYSAKLPEGPERAIAERACLVCHGAQLINQQHKDDAGWEKTIAQMEKWGAPLKPGEHPALKAYLVRKLGPKPSNGGAPGRPAHP